MLHGVAGRAMEYKVRIEQLADKKNQDKFEE